LTGSLPSAQGSKARAGSGAARSAPSQSTAANAKTAGERRKLDAPAGGTGFIAGH